MQEVINPIKFTKNLNFKISNMNMNIKIQNDKLIKLTSFSYSIDPKKLKNYTLPTFTKKILNYLEKNK